MFAKVSTTNGVDLMYNPKVFGKPESGEVGIWLSYWPIGSTLNIGDTVNVCIAVMSGLEVHECGATLMYSDDEIAEETLENNMGWEEVIGGDLSGFQLSIGAYYLCRRDFFQLMEVERLTPDWFMILVGDTINYTEVRGWRKTGRPNQSNPSFTELKTVRCIIHGPGAEEIYNLTEMSKSSLLDKGIEFTSSILEETMKSGTTYEISDEATKDVSDSYSVETMGMSKTFVSDKITESASIPREEKLKSVITDDEVSDQDKESETSSIQGSQPCRHFEFPEIQLATNDFDESLVIGSGGSGKVYKGEVIYGSIRVFAAIKRLDSTSNQGAAEIWPEVEMLSKLRHSNLVSLIGYCNYEKEAILLYEYMSNGTLEDHLHKLGTPLSWIQQLNICIGAARGLDYLHTGTGIELGIIHGDVKSSNILLHESWTAKISDFGLSRTATTNQPSTYNTLVKGTFWYMDPVYFYTGKQTRKSDVYSFGVVLLEVLCRKRALDTALDEEQRGLAVWAQESIKKGNLKHIINSDIRDQISPKCLKEFVGTVESCLHSNPRQPCTMAEVVVILEYLLTSQEKFNNSSQPASRTIFGRMLDMIGFSSKREIGSMLDTIGLPSKGENSAQRDSSTSAGNTVEADHNMFLETREVPADYKIPSLKIFKFADLKRATRNFRQDPLLGKGGFGEVFKGWVDENMLSPSKPGTGIVVYVKRLHQGSSQGHDEWQPEVSLLGRLNHPNIITLLRYSNDEKEEYLLVYEFMGRGSFDRYLFANANAAPLPWGRRLMIMTGVARGLAYLHSSKPQVIWHGAKSSDILLEQDFNAKLGDFGLAKCGPETHATTRVMGTRGYVAPKTLQTGHLTVKNDIYGFGVVLLETLTGLRVLDTKRPYGQQNLVEWASPFLASRKKLNKIMDPRLERNYPLKAAEKCAELALRCLANNPKDRPSSEEVLQSLEQIYVVNK